MATDQECVDYARECIHLAELTKDLQLRDWLLTTAREWMATASKQSGRAWHSPPQLVGLVIELAMSASGHSRPSWSKPLGHALPLRPESGRNDSSSSGRFGSENRIYPEQIMSTFSCRFLSKARSTMGALVPPASSARRLTGA
jgi:hypothetical protein